MRKIFDLRGFTLVELLVTIGIIATLITTLIVVSNPNSQLQKTNDAKRKAELTQLQKALDAYYSDYNRYPAAVNGQISGALWGGSWGQYMAKIPKDPRFSQRYLYQAASDGSWYRIFAKLEHCPDANTIPGVNCARAQYNYTVVSPNLSVLAYGGVEPSQAPPPTFTPVPTFILPSSTPTPTPLPTLTPRPTPTPTPTPIPTPTPLPMPPPWIYSRDFSGVQNTNNLSYYGFVHTGTIDFSNPISYYGIGNGSYSQVSYDGNCYKPSGVDPNFCIKRSQLSPAWQADAIVRWTAPNSRNISITGSFNRCNGCNSTTTNTSRPLTTFYIRKNLNTLLLSQYINDETSYNINLSNIHVNSGDTIEFWVSAANLDSGWDIVDLNFTIAYP